MQVLSLLDADISYDCALAGYLFVGLRFVLDGYLCFVIFYATHTLTYQHHLACCPCCTQHTHTWQHAARSSIVMACTELMPC